MRTGCLRSKPATVVVFPLAFLAAASLPSAFAAGATSVLLPGSVQEVKPWTQLGPPSPRHPFVSRQTLTAAENASTIDFELALKMRDLPGLQARIAQGEHISSQEMAARYDPLPADYQAAAGAQPVFGRDRRHSASLSSVHRQAG